MKNISLIRSTSASPREPQKEEAKPALVPKLRFSEFRGKEWWAASPDAAYYRNLVDSLAVLIAPLETLHQQAVEALEPSVQGIIASRSRDADLIEHTLDYLLDHACIPQGLALFKRLCCYYWKLNPQATADYIFAYRELWDSDDQKPSDEPRAGNVPNALEVK